MPEETFIDKSKVHISMDYVRLLQPSPDSIDNLVLVDPHALETIQALSMKQTSASRSWSADFIEGKGTGQIILLHGELPKLVEGSL